MQNSNNIQNYVIFIQKNYYKSLNLVIIKLTIKLSLEPTKVKIKILVMLHYVSTNLKSRPKKLSKEANPTKRKKGNTKKPSIPIKQKK